MPSALGKRHLRWLIAVRPRGTIGRKSKIEIRSEMWYGWRSGPPLNLAHATISIKLLYTLSDLHEPIQNLQNF